MKKWLLVGVLLAFPTLCFSSIQKHHMGILAIQGAGACATPSTGDELNEGFLGTGYENSWTESGATVDEDFTLSGSPPVGSCAEGLNVNTSASNAFTYWDRGSSYARTSDIDIVCEIYVDSSALDAFSTVPIIHWDDDNVTAGSGGTGMVLLRVGSSSDYSIVGKGSDTSATIAIAFDTEYTVTLHLDGTAASSTIQCSGCADETAKTFTRSEADGRYFYLGGLTDIGAGESVDIEFGYCYVNTP